MGERSAKSNIDNEAKNKRLWLAFGRWLGMEEPIVWRDVRHHIRSKWIDLKYTVDFQNNKPQSITTAHISRKEKAHLIISARGNLHSLKKVVKFRYLTVSDCVTDVEGGTLIHLGVLDNSNVVSKATNAVNHYYFHTLNNPSHRSDEFWGNFIEHFGVYA
jgi:hypothetical protein